MGRPAWFAGNWPVLASVTCWPCPRTARSGTWTPSRLPMAVVVNRNSLFNSCEGGANRFPKMLGRERKCATRRKGHWWTGQPARRGEIDRKVGDEETLVVIRTSEETARCMTTICRRAGHHTGWRVCSRGESGAPHRRVPSARQERGWAGRLSGANVDWLAPSYHASLMATWFLVLESQRGKKWTPAITVPQIRKRLAQHMRRTCGCDTPARIIRECQRWLDRIELLRLYHHKAHNQLPPRRFHQRR